MGLPRQRGVRKRLAMSYSNRSALSILLTLTAAACAEPSGAADPEPNSLRAASNEDPECLGNLAVGWTAEAQCPALGDWKITELFAFTSIDSAAPGTARWCRYEGGPGQTLSGMDDPSTLHDLSQECIGVFAQTDLQADMAPDLAESFQERIGDIELSQLAYPGGASAEDFRQPTMVAVIDTIPDSTQWPVSKEWDEWEQADANSMHGIHMARIIDDIACPDPDSCAVVIESHLGLPRAPIDPLDPNDDGVDPIRGGYGGTHGDFAFGIVEAVDSWRDAHADLESTPDPSKLTERMPLILNLSAGWESGIVGLVAGSEPGRVLAVRSALEYASCNGALILAAVGNDAGHCEDGPLAPALWEDNMAPDHDRCMALGVDDSDLGRLPGPLLYGVSGLGELDELMPGTRAFSNARVAAPATYVVAGNDPYTVPLTGTSVAAASASGVAALAWSFAPSRTPAEVMGLLYNSGRQLTETAHTYPGSGDAPFVSRINACDAVQQVCDASSGCNLSLGCTASHGEAALAAAYSQVVAATAVMEIEDTLLLTSEACSPLTCGAYEATSLDDPCTATESDPLDAYVFPQPPDPPCPVCALNGDVLTGSRNSAYDRDTVESISLILKDISGLRKIDLTDSFDLRTSDVSRVQIQNFDLASFTGTAWIQVKFEDYPLPVKNTIGSRTAAP